MNLLVRLQPWFLFAVALGLGGCSTPPRTPVAAPPATPTAVRDATATQWQHTSTRDFETDTHGGPNPWKKESWQHTSTRDFETEFPGKGLGVGRRYDSEDGWADVYIYDLGEPWQEGCSDPKFAAAFDAACDDVRAAAALGHYTELHSDAPRNGRAGGLPIRSARFSYRHQGKPIESYLVMTCVRGHVLKARVSLFVPVPANAWAIVQALIEQQVRLIP